MNKEDREKIIAEQKKKFAEEKAQRHQRIVEYFQTMGPIKDEDHIPEVPIFKDRKEFEEVVIKNLIRCGAIPKSELEVGAEYLGSCRNASKAKWDGKKFIYQRYKWGSWYEDTIEHFEDDTQYDVFVPIKKITSEDVKDSEEETES